MKSGKVSHAYLGVTTTDGSGAGAQVASVASGGPAADAGLKSGDVITGLGGKSVEDSSSLSGLVDAHKAGETVSVTVRRDGQDKTLQVKLGERPATTDSSSQQDFGGNGSGPGDGQGW
jgi:putative serine protease PepD